jgi:thiamine biosynthesis protein ThiS
MQRQRERRFDRRKCLIGEAMNNTIEIIVNGHPEVVPAASTLQSLILLFKEYDVDLIVERNGRFVYSQKYAETVIQEKDIIEFINPNIGG